MEQNSNKSQNHGLLLFLAVISAGFFTATANPPGNFWIATGELRVFTSLFLPIMTFLFFVNLIQIGFLIIGFPLDTLLRAILALWSLMFLFCLVVNMPSRLLAYAALGVSVAAIFSSYRMVKEDYMRQCAQSDLKEADAEADAEGRELIC